MDLTTYVCGIRRRIKDLRAARDPRPGPLFWARKGERSPVPGKIQDMGYRTATER